MSLDVYLKKDTKQISKRKKIFIRENGSTREITRKEWDENYPGVEPVVVYEHDDNGIVFHKNITHNLGKMAEMAGLYSFLWRPEEINITTANELIEPLEEGRVFMKNNKKFFQGFNPENGWGNYDGLLAFVIEYLEACKNYPDATIEVDR